MESQKIENALDSFKLSTANSKIWSSQIQKMKLQDLPDCSIPLSESRFQGESLKQHTDLHENSAEKPLTWSVIRAL